MGVYSDWFEKEEFQRKLTQRCPEMAKHPSVLQGADQTFQLFQWTKNNFRRFGGKSARVFRRYFSAQKEQQTSVGITQEQVSYSDPPPPALDRTESEIQNSNAFRHLLRAPVCDTPQASDYDFDVIHCIGSLNAGGAERQLCYLAREQSKRGLRVGIMTMHPLIGDQGHYSHLLDGSDVTVWTVGDQFDDSISQQFKDRPDLSDAVRSLEPEIQFPVLDLLGEVFSKRTRVLHTWLDHCNIWAGYAGALAGVESVILSTRNVNPMNFPYLAIPWFRSAYHELLNCPRVGWINNSQAGADDYNRWLGAAQSPIRVIRNGVDLSVIQRPSPNEISQARDEFGASESDIVIIGIFRLSEEKQPLTFIALLKRLIDKGYPVRGVIVGVGPLEDDILRAVSESQEYIDRIQYLGRRNDIPALICASDIVVLCSRLEGTPNVLLEAQQLRRAVVATKGGGSAEAFKHGHTGFCVEYDDLDAITDAVEQLVLDPELRKSFGDAGPAFIAENFGLDRMVEEHLSLYQSEPAHAVSAMSEEGSSPLAMDDLVT